MKCKKSVERLVAKVMVFTMLLCTFISSWSLVNTKAGTIITDPKKYDVSFNNGTDVEGNIIETTWNKDVSEEVTLIGNVKSIIDGINITEEEFENSTGLSNISTTMIKSYRAFRSNDNDYELKDANKIVEYTSYGRVLNGTNTLKLMDDLYEATWYKLSDEKEGSFTIKKKVTENGEEIEKDVVITYTYYTVKEISKEAILDLGVLTREDIGCYIHVGKVFELDPTVANDNIYMNGYTVFEQSDLGAITGERYTYASIGGSAQLKIYTESTRPITCEWYKGQIPETASVEGLVKLDETSTTLSFENITKEDFGIYSCRVTDGIVGWQFKTMELLEAEPEEKEKEDKEDEFVLGKTTSIKAATTKSTSIKLTWAEVEGADTYRVYVAKDGAWKVLKTSTASTSFTATGLTAGKSYTFAVKAFKDGVAAATFTKQAFKTAPGKTTKISVGRGYTSIKLTWNKVESATGYRVYQWNGSTWVQVRKSGTTNTHTIKGLKSGKSYKFAVKAYRIEDGKVLWSDVFTSVTTKTVAK